MPSLELKISSLCKIKAIGNMQKKFIKVTIERHDVTEDYDENFFDEYYIQEEEFIKWATQQMNLGWVVKCENTIIFSTPEEVELPKVILIREVED